MRKILGALLAPLLLAGAAFAADLEPLLPESRGVVLRPAPIPAPEEEPAGDKGVGASMELLTPSLTRAMAKNACADESQLAKLPEVRLAGFWDWGVVRRNGRLENYEDRSITMSGAGVGLRAQWGEHFSARIDYAWRLKDTGREDDDRKNGYLHFTDNAASSRPSGGTHVQRKNHFLPAHKSSAVAPISYAGETFRPRLVEAERSLERIGHLVKAFGEHGGLLSGVPIEEARRYEK